MNPVRPEHLFLKSTLEWLLQARNPDGDMDVATGRRKLTYSRRFLWTAAVVAVVANAAFGLTMLLTRDDRPAQAWSFGIFGLLWLAAMIGAWDALWTQMSVSEDGIHLERRHRKPVLIPWPAISRVRYSRLGSWFTFNAPGYPAVRISAYRNGLHTLAVVADRRLREPARARASSLLGRMNDR